jgi:Ca2+-binding EF-hand superfamily protein
MRQAGATPSAHAAATVQPALRHHRKHQERPLLFASSEPVHSVVPAPAPAGACVPWLAELRAVDLYNSTGGEVGRDAVDMKKLRRVAFEKRVVGGYSGLQKMAFMQSLNDWFKGPTHDEGELLFDQLDSSGDGMLSFQEYNWENLCGLRGLLLAALAADGKTWTQGFSFMDTNTDGDISQEEFVEECTGKNIGLSSTTAEDLFKVVDADSSGVVNRTEFEAVGGLPRLRVQVAEKESDESVAFKQADLNKDGHLDDFEFMRHAENMGDFRDESVVPPIMHELDKNKDGKVEKDEYVNKCWTKTAGLCSEGRCQRWRGPASCAAPYFGQLDKPCVCAPGYCTKNGACIPEELHNSEDFLLGPDAGHMLEKMEQVSAENIYDKYFKGHSNMNPAEGVVAVMLTISILIQLKYAFQAFPALGVLMFTISVIAFYLVTKSCFRAFSVPDSIENTVQLLVLLLVYAAITVSATSLTRIWAPPNARIPIICWFVTDDLDEYGLNRCEELKVQAYLNLFHAVTILCAIGMYEAPLEGVNRFSTKFMLVVLYVCIVILDTQLLNVELKACSARRYRFDLYVCQVTPSPQSKPEVHMASLPCLSAWWNELLLQRHLWQFRDAAGLQDRLDPYHEEQISNVRTLQDNTKRFCKFTTVRTPVESQTPATAAMGFKSQVPPKGSNELFFLSPRHGGNFGHYVHGKVVVMWEDTEIEFAWKSDNFFGGTTASPWRTVDALELDPNVGTENTILRELPGVMVIHQGSGRQTLQQKMLVLTQAGAAGLIIGQRGPGNLNADQFQLYPDPPDRDFDLGNRKSVWRGAYYLRRYAIYDQGFDSKVIYSESKDAYSRHDFVEKWLGNWWTQTLKVIDDVPETAVEDGVAINSFLITAMDMQELQWALEERHQDSGHDMDSQRNDHYRSKGATGSEAPEGSGPLALDLPPVPTVMYAVFAKRRRPATFGEMKDRKSFGGFIVPAKADVDLKLQKSFAKVVAHQHQILQNVITKEEGPMDFLVGVREWVEKLWFIQTKVWRYIHLLASGAALVFVVDMSRMIYRRIHSSDFGFWADLMVIGIMVLNGQNISIPIDWFPFRREAASKGSIGLLLTAILLVGYSLTVLILFFYNVFEGMFG